ncbi:hypothetical protein LIER_27517 [Lithospermum erythrorhizon]|uniref:Uncharacterized protein n=1 Tax=Lithospermum erythrorhizon TaxID=34254 RepID=A0AAV3RFE6_LITER
MHAEAQEEKKAARQQALGEIAKCDVMLQEQTQLASEVHGLSNKLTCLEASLTKAERNAQSLKKCAEEAEAAKQAAERSADNKVRQALEEFRFSDTYRVAAGGDSTYCLYRFAKTYKDTNPHIVANYEEFISEYPSEWFANVHVHAPLSPLEE